MGKYRYRKPKDWGGYIFSKLYSLSILYYIPVKNHRKIWGLKSFAFENPEEVLAPENKELFETTTFLGALALESL